MPTCWDQKLMKIGANFTHISSSIEKVGLFDVEEDLGENTIY